MADFRFPILTTVLLAVLGSTPLLAQIPANLSASAPVLAAPAMADAAADLSVQDSSGAVSKKSGSSLSGPRVVITSSSSAHSGPMNESSSSHASRGHEYQKRLQEAFSSSGQMASKSPFHGGAGPSILGSPIRRVGLGKASYPGASAPHSTSSSSSTAQAPLYSFLIRHEKAGSRSSGAKLGGQGKSGSIEKSASSLVEALRGAGSTRSAR